MALAAKFYSDITAQDTVTGTGDSIAVTTPTLYAALAPIRLLFTASAANTGAATLNLDGLGAKAVRKISGGTDVALVAGDIPGAGTRVEVVYSATANSAAGAWILIVLGNSSISDSAFRITDNGDATKKLAFEVSAITTSTTRTVTVPDASGTLPLLDANNNLSADNFNAGWISEVAGAITLTVDSLRQHYNGGTNSVYTLPVTSTLVLGQSFEITNNPGNVTNVTVNSSGGNLVASIAPGVKCTLTCVVVTGASAASWNASFGGTFTLAGTANTNTGGTAISFTSVIPAGVKRFTLMVAGLSFSGTSIPIVQLGVGGTYQTSSYNGSTGRIANTTGGTLQLSSGIALETTGGAANTYSTAITGQLVDAATGLWLVTVNGGLSNTISAYFGGGSKVLSGVLDSVRVTATNGTDTIDANGGVNLSWE